MLLSWTAVVCLAAVCQGGRYKAPDPLEVRFPYNRIPTITELINDAGYKHEPHLVTTEDGHILALHRISQPAFTSEERGVPVLIISGFTYQADSFLALGNASLPFTLVNLGYDVWLGEKRGNERSLGHVEYEMDDFRNFNYSIHEQGIYDLPSLIDYILEATGRSQILYVGYSLSCGMVIVMNSERPEYNDKLQGVVFLAPAGHLKKLEENPFDYASGVAVLVSMIESQIQNRQWLLFGKLEMIKSLYLSCSNGIINLMCRTFINAFYGLSTTTNPKYLGYQLALATTTECIYTAKHLMQVIKHGRFCKYDYGKRKNMEVYGSSSPPNYNFNNTKAPVFLFYGTTDKMVTPDAAKRTGKEVGYLYDSATIKGFDHGDFLLSVSAPRNVYERIIDYFDTLTGKH
ncbi:hypothetical protein GE061_003942 [Apolygus lucorum]|uniref:Lipase n=1 Tax=Apolygus lucorum TaxID=248454 RepID=A0A8S9WZM5_APOLU|nr:hypothetical protein GE061_003942 [Apolygus lucorum]